MFATSCGKEERFRQGKLWFTARSLCQYTTPTLSAFGASINNDDLFAFWTISSYFREDSNFAWFYELPWDQSRKAGCMNFERNTIQREKDMNQLNVVAGYTCPVLCLTFRYENTNNGRGCLMPSKLSIKNQTGSLQNPGKGWNEKDLRSVPMGDKPNREEAWKLEEEKTQTAFPLEICDVGELKWAECSKKICAMKLFT